MVQGNYIYIYHTLSLSLYGCPYTYIIYMATIHVAISLAIYFTLIWNVNLLRLQKHRKTTMAFGWLTQGVCQMRASPRSLHPVESYVLLLVNVLEVLETCMWTAQLSSTINSMRSSFFWGFLVLTATWQPPSTKKKHPESTFFFWLFEVAWNDIRNCPTWKKNNLFSGEKTPHQWRQGTQSCSWAPSVRFDTTLSASAIPTHGRLPGEVNWLIWQVSKVSNRVT